ncbi:platelet glycoprotein 4-like isoform X2 [Panonychus citri]|uniref:platelet glycoprotein 4-like isoform X2 n=1 Tax=Panonychus citri TaxID=50023 RepID=UPI002307DFF2|nr:platelet glycoprotein 4-like isoform X2 [Panonychus citri]
MNKIVFLSLGGIGIAIALISAIVLGQFPNMIQKQVSKQLVVSECSEDYEKFLAPNVPIYLKFYVFHVDNPEAILAGEKPILVQKGPYSFLEKRVKEIDGYHECGDEVVYKETKTYHFDPETSRKSASLDDVVTHINVPAMTVMGASFHLPQKGMGQIFRSLFPQLATQKTKTTMFLNHTVRELLFETYPIEFIDDLNSVLAQLKQPSVNLTDFAFFMDKNATDEGEFRVHTGAKKIKNLLHIESWKGSPQVDFWIENSTCNNIVGTDGSAFPPNVKKNSKLEIFTTDLCRSFPLVYKEKVKVKGISTYRFVIPPEAFYGPEKNPENKCFCINPDPKTCNHNGLLDISSCRQFAPLVASSPHFFQADDDLYNAIIGLDERKADRYQTYLDIEPITGKVLSAFKRLQISAWLKNDYSIEKTNTNVYMPVIWVEEGFTLTDELADEFKSKVTKKVNLGSSLLITALIIGLLLIVAGLGLFFYNKFQSGN